MPTRSAAAPPENAGLKILRRKQVEERVGLSCSTLYALIAADKFPKPIQLSGAQAVGWIESEIDAFLRERIAASRAATDSIVKQAKANDAAHGQIVKQIRAHDASMNAIVKQAEAHGVAMEAIVKRAPKPLTPPKSL